MFGRLLGDRDQDSLAVGRSVERSMRRFLGSSTGGGSIPVSNRPEIEIRQQTAFGEDGQLEVTETSVETSLEDFGAEVDHRDCDSRLDRPSASQFGVDDRPEVRRSAESDQSTLFADTEESQKTLAGDSAAAQCLFEDDERF